MVLCSSISSSFPSGVSVSERAKSKLFLGEDGEAALLRLLDLLERGATGSGGVVFSMSVSRRVDAKGMMLGLTSRKPEVENWPQSAPMLFVRGVRGEISVADLGCTAMIVSDLSALSTEEELL